MSETHRRYSRTQAIASGALAGAVAANSMTLLRMFARRKGWIDKTTPQVMEEWLLDQLALDLPGGHLGHHALDQLLHIGYGGMLGAIEGALYGRMGHRVLRRGLVVGVVTWSLGALVLLPLTGAGRAAWESDVKENGINLASHLLFGLGTALLTKEMFLQTARGPTDTQERQATRVG